MFRRALLIAGAWALVEAAVSFAAPGGSPLLELHTRSRKLPDGSNAQFELVQGTVSWAPSKTALVVVDMWDDHWCRSAAKRVGRLAGPMNRADRFGTKPRRADCALPQHVRRLLYGHTGAAPCRRRRPTPNHPFC